MAFDTRKVISWWLVLLQLSASWLFVVAQLNGEESSERPYIILVETAVIKKLNLNSSGVESVEMIHDTRGFSIVGLDYHHRLNTVYWILSTPFGKYSYLYKRSLDPQKEEVHILKPINGKAVGIAVDWINDKIYWTQRHKIVQFDMNTNVTTDIATLTGNPMGIGVFPYKNNAWLYFMEKGRISTKGSTTNALVRMPAVHGGTQTVLHDQNIDCPNAITMDYPNTNVYWNDACRKQIEVIRIDGTKHRHIYDGNDMLVTNTHSTGIAYYNGIIYWTDTTKVFRFNTTTNTMQQSAFYSPRSGVADGIRVVHSSLQPTEDQLQLYEMCTSIECVHGQCISNISLCACDPGWSGDACDQDINECEANNGGCEETCTNTVGSFHCKCHEGQTLQSNKRNCSNANSPAPISVTPIPSSRPTGSRNPIPDPSTDPIPIPSTDTIPIPSTDTSTIPSTDTSTDSISIPSSTAASSLPRDHVSTTESNAVTSSSSSGSTNTVPTVSSTDDKKKLEQPTSNDYDSAKTTPTQQQLRPSPTPTIFGLKPNTKQPESPPNLLIIVVSTATGTVVLASIFCYIIFLYCKLSRKRRGSYNVNKRERARDVESATSSARSSFRAVSEYHYSPNLENQFLRQILPGSTSSMSEGSTTAVSVAPATSSESMSASSSASSSSAANESSAESESQPLRLDSCKR